MTAAIKSSHPFDTALERHNQCKNKEICLLFLLPLIPREIVIGYLTLQKAPLYFGLCTKPGWEKSQCTDQNIRTLLLEKVNGLLAIAEERATRAKTSKAALGAGMWYGNTFFGLCKAHNLAPHLNQMRSSGDFYHGRPPKGFSYIVDSNSHTEKKVHSYLLTDPIPPAMALRNFRDSLCLIDCNVFVQLAYLEVILEVIGEAKFNERFRHDGKNPLRVDSERGLSSMKDFLASHTVEKGDVGKRAINVGDWVFFRNLQNYSLKHPHGDMQGFHAVCTAVNPVQKFAGFGFPLVTENEIYDRFGEAFMATPLKENEIVTEEVAKKCHSTQLTADTGLSYDTVLATTLSMHVDRSFITQAEKLYPDQIGFYTVVIRPNLSTFLKYL